MESKDLDCTLSLSNYQRTFIQLPTDPTWHRRSWQTVRQEKDGFDDLQPNDDDSDAAIGFFTREACKTFAAFMEDDAITCLIEFYHNRRPPSRYLVRR
ncbi:hypothetical protein M413DRAFT_156125 [Hebeloma cylindrosporum]|uniref:Uncharacterized protein n=1 Tax=Hebeloma cylindrosporum TaxID=76867 RepID=A0A0C3C9M2_HEBCY|nr:hypothetical protein M413DRAFT_156125 [Hebeloma cylindrosporum h7]